VLVILLGSEHLLEPSRALEDVVNGERQDLLDVEHHVHGEDHFCQREVDYQAHPVYHVYHHAEGTSIDQSQDHCKPKNRP
jgi:hypothetical protein